MTATSTTTREPSRERDRMTVVAHDLVKTYGSHRALAGVSLSVAPGQVYGILGPNGAGKTTLLRALLGLVRCDSGSVHVLGSSPGSAAALRQTGAMIEQPTFVPGLSGRVNLDVLAAARGAGAAEVTRVLELVDLAHAAARPVKTYSMGMKQRLGVAAAVLGSPRLLVLDEPTNGLDPEGVVDMRGLLRSLAAEGATLLVSSHVLSEVEQICDSVLVLHQGRVVADGAVSDLTRQAGGTTELLLRVEPVAEAESVLSGSDLVTGLRHLTVDERTVLACHVQPEAAARIPELLVRSGVTVHEITHKQRRLEDIFLDLTHQGDHA